MTEPTGLPLPDGIEPPPTPEEEAMMWQHLRDERARKAEVARRNAEHAAEEERRNAAWAPCFEDLEQAVYDENEDEDLDEEDAEEARWRAAAFQFMQRAEHYGWREDDQTWSFVAALLHAFGYQTRHVRNHGTVWVRP